MFATRAAAAGVEVELFVAPDLPHAFQAFDCGITKLWGVCLTEWFQAHLPE
jgi:acetyl esterase/lipase